MKSTEFKSTNTGKAADKARKHLADNDYVRVGPEDSTEFWKHKTTGKKVYVTHYKIGRSIIDEGYTEAKSVISEMIVDRLVEGTAGDTNLVDATGKLTHRGYAAMYAWKKAGHRGIHPSIRLERKAKGLREGVEFTGQLIEQLSDADHDKLQNLYWEKHGPTHPTIRHSSGNQPTVGTHPDHPGVYLVGRYMDTHAFKRNENGKDWDYVGTAHSVYEKDDTHPLGRKQVYGKIEIRKAS